MDHTRCGHRMHCGLDVDVSVRHLLAMMDETEARGGSIQWAIL